MKTKPAQQIAFTCVFIEGTDRDPADVKLSYAHADRSRRKINKICGNEERLVVAVRTRDEAKLLCAPLFTTGAMAKLEKL